MAAAADHKFHESSGPVADPEIGPRGVSNTYYLCAKPFALDPKVVGPQPVSPVLYLFGNVHLIASDSFIFK